MTTARALTPSLLLVTALLACGPIPTGQEPPSGGNCSTLTLTAQDVVTAAPSRISLFFSVDGCGGDPVPGLSADAFELFEDDKPISSFESQKTIQPKGQRFRMYSLVLLDLSGSILKSGNFPALAEAAKLYVDEVLKSQGDGQRVAVYAFDGRPTLTPVVDFSSDAAVLKAGIDRLSTRECNVNADCVGFADRRACAGWLCVDDSTNLNGAVVAGVDRLERELRAEPGIPFKDSALIVFTDGTDQAARVSRDDALAKVRSGQPHVFAIGLGGEVDESAMRDLGQDGFERADHASQLSEVFGDIANRIVGLASRFYLLEYCSPKRSGTHRLMVKARVAGASGERTGSLTRSFDATGFESGCEVRAP